MRPLKQIQAARANEAKSRGPTTTEGKLVSSQNATQHGMSSRTVLLQCESQHCFEQVLAALKDQIQSCNSAESGFLEIMAIARWRQMRFRKIQRAAIKLQVARAESANDVPCETSGAGLTSDDVVLKKLRRYETSYHRQFLRAKAAIQKIRRQDPLVAKRFRLHPTQPGCLRPREKSVFAKRTDGQRKKLFCKTNRRPKMKHTQLACETRRLAIDS